MRTSLLVACAAVLPLGCFADTNDASKRAGASVGDAHGGTMIVTTGADADYLLPPLVTTSSGRQVTDMLFERLAEPGEPVNTLGDEGFTGRLAERWEWAKDSLSIAFALSPLARWHDGKPVRARDVKFTYDLYTEPKVGSSTAPTLAHIDSVTVRDSLTAVFWFERRYPTQFFDAVYHMRILPEHLLAGVDRAQMRTAPFARNPVGSGRFRFARWEKNSLIEVVADTAHYRARPHLDRIIWSVAPDPAAATMKLLAGEADFLEYVPPAQLAELAKNPDLTIARYPSLAEGSLQFNLRDPARSGRPHPIFGDRAVRRALTMAVDRKRVVRSVMDSLGLVAIGPVARAQSSADTTIAQIPYDAEAARRLLDSLGWRDGNNDGVREKNGRALRFTIIAPSSSSTRIRMAVLLQEMFKQVGAAVDVRQMEMNRWVEEMQGRRFDATMNAIMHDPTPASIRESWGSEAARSKTGMNYVGYQNPVFDAYVDSAVATMDPVRTRAHYRRAYETILADAPAIWLYEPVNVAGVHKRIRPAGMRADAWWAGIADWSIPASQRIARDRVGLRPAAN